MKMLMATLVFSASTMPALAQSTGEAPNRATAELFSCPPPTVNDYPAAALRVEVQGDTEVELSVAADTRHVEAKVVKSSGETREHKLLDRVALKIFSECRYVGPVPTQAVTTRLTHKFALSPVR
jgi:TonB family protein